MEGKRGCELCGMPARMYCESDQANLCRICDERVHSANFLVAKHTRRLLCQVCQSPTPWVADGLKLGTTVSVCDGCFDSHGKDPEVGRHVVEEGRHDVEEDGYSVNEVIGDEDGDDDDDPEDDDDDDDHEMEDEEIMEDDEYDDDEEEDGENQVVPWSFDSPPPPADSSSNSGEESAAFTRGGGSVLGPKRVWDIAFRNDSGDEIGCALSQGTSRAFAATEEGPSAASFQLVKKQRFGESSPTSPARIEFCRDVSKPATPAIIDSLKRLQNNAMSDDGSAAAVLGIYRLSRC